MVKLVHHNVVVEIRGGLSGKILGVEGLNGQKQAVNALWPVAAHKQLPEVGILQNRSEGVQALPQDLLSMGDKEQPAGLAGMLFAKSLVVQRGDHRLARAGGGHHQVAGVAPDGALRLQLVQDLLLVGVGRDIHGVHFGVVGVEVFFCPQRPGQPLLLILGVVLKLAGVPVALEGGGDLVDGLRQIPAGHLHIPLQTTGDGGVGQVG